MILKPSTALIILMTSPVSACEEGHDCLGHHWHDLTYLGEIRWQLTAMTLFFAVCGVSVALRWYKSSRATR